MAEPDYIEFADGSKLPVTDLPESFNFGDGSSIKRSELSNAQIKKMLDSPEVMSFIAQSKPPGAYAGGKRDRDKPPARLMTNIGRGVQQGVIGTLSIPGLLGRGLVGLASKTPAGSPDQVDMSALQNVLNPVQYPAIKEGAESLGMNPNPDPGRSSSTLGEFMGASILPGVGRAAAARKLAPIAKEAGSALMATAGYEGVGLATDNKAAQLAGGVLAPAGLGNLGSQIVKGTLVGDVAEQAAARQTLRETQGIGATLGTVTQKPIYQTIEGGLAGTTGGTTVLRQKARDIQSKFGKKLMELTGTNKITSKAGGDILTGKKSGKGGFFGTGGTIDRMKADDSARFEKFNKLVPPETKVYPVNTLKTLDEITVVRPTSQNLDANSLATSDKLVQYKKDILADLDANFNSGNIATGQPLPQPYLQYETLKRLRTKIRNDELSSKITGDTAEGQYRQVYASLTKDMESIAGPVGSASRKAFDDMNLQYAKNSELRNQFFDKINKKFTSKQAFQDVVNGNDPEKFKIVKEALNPDEWDAFRGIVFNRMGMTKPGRVNVEGTEFSTADFLTSWNNAKSEGVIDVLLKGPTKYKENMNALASTAAKLKNSASVLANPSGTTASGMTAMVILGSVGAIPGAVVGTVAGGPGGGAAGGLIAGAISGYYGTKGLAKLVTHEPFINWMAQGTKLPLNRLPGHISRLAAVSEGVTDPELMADLETYADRLATLLEEMEQSDDFIEAMKGGN